MMDRSPLFRISFPLFTALLVLSIFTINVDAGETSQKKAVSKPQCVRIPVSKYPVFEDDLNYERLSECIQGSISYYKKLPSLKPVSFGANTFTVSHLIQSLKGFLAFIEKKPSRGKLKAFIDTHYQVYAFTDTGKPVDVLFTGYYEPLLHGSLGRSLKFKYPVYSKPDDLAADVPYYTRRQIEETDVLAGKVSPIAWVDDPVALFFLHIQGSGKISLESGEMLNVHYKISNNYPYKSIGKCLIDKKKILKKNISMQSIREYLNTHPEEINEILNYNPRYIFFETVDAGPTGCFDIDLTPGRSIALERRSTPPGALAFIQTQKPVVGDAQKIQSWIKFSRFVLNQDTGSAIKGSGRADIFWGTGTYAELAAGYMKYPGQLYFLVLRPGLHEPFE
ncbi:MAG: murein transglycosylase A [Dissulfuribacterales bacterium]